MPHKKNLIQTNVYKNNMKNMRPRQLTLIRGNENSFEEYCKTIIIIEIRTQG